MPKRWGDGSSDQEDNYWSGPKTDAQEENTLLRLDKEWPTYGPAAPYVPVLAGGDTNGECPICGSIYCRTLYPTVKYEKDPQFHTCDICTVLFHNCSLFFAVTCGGINPVYGWYQDRWEQAAFNIWPKEVNDVNQFRFRWANHFSSSYGEYNAISGGWDVQASFRGEWDKPLVLGRLQIYSSDNSLTTMENT